MANGKTMQAVVNLAGSIDPSLGKAIEQAQKKISGLNTKALAVGAAVGGIAVATGKAVLVRGLRTGEGIRVPFSCKAGESGTPQGDRGFLLHGGSDGYHHVPLRCP